MARRREEEDSGGSSGDWLNTFADLMNLLLCFFVLLFSMSSVDADKYEALVTSLSSSISIFDGGSPGVEEGSFLSSGADQMVSIAEYFNEFEQSGTSEEDSKEELQGMTADEIAQKKAEEKIEKERVEKIEEIYEGVKTKATEKGIIDIVDVSTDENYQYVQISLKGAILFDSGKADIKANAISVLSKVSDILKLYSGHWIKIEGHTDNVPISNSRFKNNMQLSIARASSVFDYFVENQKLNPEKTKMEAAGRGPYSKVAPNTTAEGRAKNRRIEIKIEPN